MTKNDPCPLPPPEELSSCLYLDGGMNRLKISNFDTNFYLLQVQILLKVESGLVYENQPITPGLLIS